MKNHEHHHNGHHEHEGGHDHKGHASDHHQGSHDHHDHHAHMIEDFKKRFYINTALSIPVLAFSEMIQNFFGVEFSFLGMGYVAAGLATFIFF